MDTKLNSEITEVLKEIAGNINVDDIKQGSYLNTLVRGLSKLNDKTLESIKIKLENIDIDTADEITLENFGAKKSIPRLKNQDVSLLAKNKGLSLSIEMFKFIPDENYKLFSKGDVVYSDVFKITFLENVNYNTNLNQVYISCNISLDSAYYLNLKTLDTGTKIKITPPQTLSNYIKNIVLTIETNLTFSNFDEDIEVYRSRLKHYMYSENVANKNSIQMLMNRVPYVSQYYIDEKETPHQIYILNQDMYTDPLVDEYLVQHSIPYAEGSIDRYRGYTSSFEFNLAKRISYTLEIETKGSNYSPEVFSGLGRELHKNHLLGLDFEINKLDIERVLESFGINVDFNFQIYYYFNGVKFPAPNTQVLEILPWEYPSLQELMVDGERVDV